MTYATQWNQEHCDALVRMILDGRDSYVVIAKNLNREFGTKFTRNAAIGKAKRLGHCKPQQIGRSPWVLDKARERDRIKKRAMRAKRWAANPSLEQRYERSIEKKQVREKMLASGNPKTSREYRTHLPRQAEMTKNELRAMLTLAVQNTALLEVA